MTLKNSTFNISLWRLMREDLRRRTWMIALSLLGSFLASPVAFLCFYGTKQSYYYHITDINQLNDPVTKATFFTSQISEFLYSEYLILNMIIIFIGALIVSIAGFKHLYSQKMVDMYHSVPVTRNKKFWVIWLNGFLIWFIPFLLGHICVYIMSLYYIGLPSFWSGMTMIFLKETLLFVICFLIIYNACLVPIMISGNSGNAFINILIYGLCIIGFFGTVIVYAAIYFSSLYLPDNIQFSPLIALSPLASPIYLCAFFSYSISEPDMIPTMISDYHCIAILVLSIIMAAFNLFLSVTLHQRRPSELAGHGVENRTFRIAFRYIVSILSGLWLAVFFCAISVSGFKNLGWLIFGAIFGCTLAFAIINIIFHTSFKALFSHKIHLLVSLALTVVIIFAFRFDVFGYDTYLPAKNTITGMSIYAPLLKGDGYSYQLENGVVINGKRNPKDIKEENIPRFTNQEQIYRFLEFMIDANDHFSVKSQYIPYGLDNYVSYSKQYFTVKVDTTKGSYYRSYSCILSDSAESVINPFITTDEFCEYYNPFASGAADTPRSITVTSVDGTDHDIKHPALIEEFYTTYAQDFCEHYDLDSAGSGYLGITKIIYHYDREDETRPDVTVSLDFIPLYERTYALLQKWYPDSIWSANDVEWESLQFSITSSHLYDFGSAENYFGLTDDSYKIPEQPEYDYMIEGEINDTALLNTLKPYLYVGNYNSCTDKYVFIGYVMVDTSIPSQSEFKTNRYHCYVKRGEVPQSLLDNMTYRILTEE